MDIPPLAARSIGVEIPLGRPVMHRQPPEVIVLHAVPSHDLRLGSGHIYSSGRLYPVGWNDLFTIPFATVEIETRVPCIVEHRRLKCGRHFVETIRAIEAKRRIVL